MQVSVEDLGGLERRITVQVPAEQIDKEVQDRLLSLSRRVRLDGFRPGKVPLKVVKRMYGPQVRQEVVGEVLQSSLRDALVQEKLHLAGGPKIEPRQVEEGADLEYSATFEVMPEFEPAEIEGIRVERPVAEVLESDIDAMLETLRLQRMAWNEVARPAQNGDRITIDFQGTRDGEDFSGGKGENVPVVLGSGSMIKAFEDRLAGLQAGDQTEFDVRFPEDYPMADVAGKVVRFAVMVKGVAEPELPEIDEEFAATFGVEEGGVETLRKAVRENMERELREGIRAVLKRQVMQALLDANDILLPQAMVAREIERLATQTHFPAAKEGDGEAAQAKVAVFEPEARRRVALGLIVSRLVASNDIKLDNARVRAHLESIASTYQDGEEVIRWYAQNPKLLEGVHALVLEDQMVDWVLERAQVIDQPSSFDQVAKPHRASS